MYKFNQYKPPEMTYHRPKYENDVVKLQRLTNREVYVERYLDHINNRTMLVKNNNCCTNSIFNLLGINLNRNNDLRKEGRLVDNEIIIPKKFDDN